MNINITKQQWMIIGVVVAAIAVWYFFLRKKKAETGYYGVMGNDGGETGYAADWLVNPNIETGYAGEGTGLLQMPESGFMMAGAGRNVGKCPQGQYPCGMSTASPGCCYENAISGRVAKVDPGAPKSRVTPFGVAGANGNVSGISGAGTSGTAESQTGGKLPDCHRTYYPASNTYGPIDNAPCMSFRGFPIYN